MLQISIAHQKRALKFDFLALTCLWVHLQLFPINYAQKIFFPLGLHVHPMHPLATPMVQNMMFFSRTLLECAIVCLSVCLSVCLLRFIVSHAYTVQDIETHFAQ